MNGERDQLLATARRLYHSGSFNEAERELEKLLGLDAGCADGWFLLGMTYRSLGRQQTAIDACRKGTNLDPRHAAAHNLLGILLAESGYTSAAIASFRSALALIPNKADTHFNLGLALLRENRVAEAMEALRSAIKLDPTHAGAQTALRQFAAPAPSLGTATTQTTVGANTAPPVDVPHERQIDTRLKDVRRCFEEGDFATAEATCREILMNHPNDARALQHLGVVLLRRGEVHAAAEVLSRVAEMQPDNADNQYGLGCALSRLGQHDEAIQFFRAAIRLRPAFVFAYVWLGNSLVATTQNAEAERCFRRAIELDAKCAEAYCGLANPLISERRYLEAEAASRRAIELQPDYGDAWNNLGRSLARQLRYQDAVECYDRAVHLDPHSPQTRYNRAFARLALGQWREAWPDYEHRFSLPELKGREIEERRWDGSPLEGRRILLYTDQALGDALQCLRYVPLVAARGGRVVLAVLAPLLRLVDGLPGMEQLCDIDKPLPPYDVQAALMSLPYLFGTTPDTVPADVPYLTAGAALVEHWRRELSSVAGFKVGIVWQGNPHFRPGLRRSIPFGCF